MTGLARVAPIGLFAVFAALCFSIAHEISDWQRKVPPHPTTSPVAVPGSSGMAEAPESPDQREAWLQQILGRPLFSPDRRRVEAGLRGLPRLTGIVVTGAQRFAIFAAPSGGHPVVVQVGAHVGAYEVRTIAETGVTVVGPEGTTLVRPVFDAARPPALASTLSLPAPRVQPTRPQTK
jgi:hypothetical protein